MFFNQGLFACQFKGKDLFFFFLSRKNLFMIFHKSRTHDSISVITSVRYSVGLSVPKSARPHVHPFIRIARVGSVKTLISASPSLKMFCSRDKIISLLKTLPKPCSAMQCHVVPCSNTAIRLYFEKKNPLCLNKKKACWLFG